MKIFYYFSLILWLMGCAWITSSNTKIVISLGEGRALMRPINLPFTSGDKLVLRIASLDGLTVYKEKIFLEPSLDYSLEVDDLAEGNVYRALAYYEVPINLIEYMDTRQFVLSNLPQIISLNLGHTFNKIELRTLDTSMDITSLYPNQFTVSPYGYIFDSTRGVDITFYVPSQHMSSFATFEYRFDNGVWNTSNITNVPEIEARYINSIQIRYRQQSNSEWLLYTVNFIY